MSKKLTWEDIEEVRRLVASAEKRGNSITISPRELHGRPIREQGRVVSPGHHCHECGQKRVSVIIETGEWLCLNLDCGASNNGVFMPPKQPTRIPGELDRLRTEHAGLIQDHARLLAAYAKLTNDSAGRRILFGIGGFVIGFAARWVFWL